MKKHKIAILGFGVVGQGVAELITNNREELCSFLGQEIEIARILDLRDFPDSPFADLVTHDFNDILSCTDIDTVIEVMGGSHPAREFTIAALDAGMNVISSNKEVVANFGNEFVQRAADKGVCYRFEAAVGGGIPVISTLLSSVRQNKIKEVRGILNGTTNYILTRMFTYGDSFDDALADAILRGYAEKNPDADILGTDAARKISILTALATDKLPSPDDFSTVGITGIRAADVAFAESIGCAIKLLGRSIINDGGLTVCVAPFLIPSDSPLASVNGVYNAVEIIGEPIGNIMLYGRGAGAGATASAVVSDLIPIISSGATGIVPRFNSLRREELCDADELVSRHYLAFTKGNEERVRRALSDAEITVCDEVYVITKPISKRELDARINAAALAPLSAIRFV